MRWVWLLLCVSACGRAGFEPLADAPPPVEPPQWTSGTRLRAVVIETPDGTAAALDHWYDTQLGVTCRFDRATDGEWRCLPTATGSASFSDAACTQPILEIDAPESVCAAQPYARVYKADATIYAVGAAWTNEVYRVNGSDPCFHYTGGLSWLQHFARGEVVAPSMFVRADEVVSPFHRLSYVSLVAEDGARERRAELYDTVLDARCSLVEVDLGHLACVPDGPVYGEQAWSDAACTQPVLHTLDPAMVVAVTSSTVCTDSTRYFNTGTELEGPFFRHDDAGGCVQVTPGASEHLYAVGSELPIDAYADFTETILDPAAPTSALAADSADGMRIMLPWRRDNVRGVRCTPTPQSPSAQLVCAPDWVSPRQVYTDAACATRADVRPSCREDVGGMWFPTSMLDYTCEGPQMQIELFDATPLAGPLWERTDAGCIPLDASVTAYPLSSTMADVSTLRPLQTRQE